MRNRIAGALMLVLCPAAVQSTAAPFGPDWRDNFECVYGHDNAQRRPDGSLDVHKQLSEHVFWFGGERMYDYALTARVKFLSAQHKYSGFSIYLRAAGDVYARRTGYWIYLRPKYRSLFMQKLNDGRLVEDFAEGIEARRPQATPIGEWLTLRAEARGRQIRVYLNDELHLAATDDGRFPVLAGRVGFGVGNAHVLIADLHQTDLETSERIQPVRYEYINPPTRGDRQRTILTDRKLNSRADQAFWRMLGKKPKIIFDLGDEYFLSTIVLRAISSPALNIASVHVEGSNDGKNWHTLATLNNEDGRRAVAEHELSGDIRRIARHLRLTLNRPAADQDVELAEVEFFGRPPTDSDRRIAAAARYDTGPEMPPTTDAPREDDNYWYLNSRIARFAIDRKHGLVAGIWSLEHDLKCMERLSDVYHLYTRNGDADSDEYADEVIGVISRTERSLQLRCRNPKLTGITLEKIYTIAEDGRRLVKRVAFTNTGHRRDRFITHGTGGIAVEAFRRGAVYMGCDRGLGARLFADQVTAPRRIGALGSRNAKTVILHRYDLGFGLAHFRHKVNDRWCRPVTSRWHEKENHPPTYLPNGWRFGVATLHLPPAKQRSTQVQFTLYNGRQYDFYGIWRDLPQVKAAYASAERPRWHLDLKTCARISVDQIARDLTPVIIPVERTLAMTQTGTLWHLSHIHGVWGNWYARGTVLSGAGAKIDTRWLKEFIHRVHRTSPRVKLGVYTWAWAVHPRSQVYQDHPEWFITHDRSGQVFNAYSNMVLNHARRFSIPQSMDHLIGQFAAIMREFDGDYFYLDGGGGGQNLIDWDHLACDQDYHYEQLYRRIRHVTRDCGDDKAVWFNARTGPWWDIGYYEGIDQILHASTWRESADGLTAVKIRHAYDPDQVVIPLYWRTSTQPFFSNYCIGLGITPSRPLGAKDQRLKLPWIEAAYETRHMRWIEAELEPDWRTDPETQIEAYALRHGPAAVISLIDHREDPTAHAAVSADTESLGLDPRRQVYAFTFAVRDIRHSWPALPESARRQLHLHTRWALDTVGRPLDVQIINQPGERISLTVPTEPHLLRMVVLTQSPAAVFSVNGLRVNFWVPDVLGTTVNAGIGDDGRTLYLQTSAPAGGAEVVVCAPAGSRLGGNRARPLFIGDHWLAIVQVPPGETTTVLTVEKAPPSADHLTVKCPESVIAGHQFTVEVQPNIDRAAVTVRRNGLLLFADDCEVGQRSFHLTPPKQLHPGELEICVRGITENGRIAHGRATVEVTGDYQPQLPPWRLPRTAPFRQIEEADVRTRGLHVLRCATESFDGRDGRQSATADPELLTVGGGMRDAPRTRYGYGFGALEFQRARVLKLRITNTFHDAWTFHRGRVSFHPQYTSTFAGMLVDYHTSDGYTKRVALGLGIINPERTDPRPIWGTKKAPSQYVSLADAIHEGRETTLTIDLAKWAPHDWDGRCWITAGAENVYPSRRIFVQILEAADSPGDRDITEGQSAGDVYRIRQYAVARAQTPPQIDGQLNDSTWAGIRPATDFLLLGQLRGSKQRTRAWAAWDQNNLYVAVDCPETAKKQLSTAAKKIWNQDAVDIMIDPDGDRKTFQQIIVNCRGRCEQFTQGRNGQEVEWNVQTASGRYDGGWSVELAVPWNQMDIEPKSGMSFTANFVRYRPYPPRDEMHTFAPMPGPKINDPERFATLTLK